MKIMENPKSFIQWKRGLEFAQALDALENSRVYNFSPMKLLKHREGKRIRMNHVCGLRLADMKKVRKTRAVQKQSFDKKSI